MTSASSIWTSASRQSVLNGLAGASSLRILVLGDLMVDQYLLGKVDRISPEAPVPILRANARDRRPGGAANVALNLRPWVAMSASQASSVTMTMAATSSPNWAWRAWTPRHVDL